MTNDAQQTKADRHRQEAELDKALENSFPASDPPAATNPSSFTGAEVARDKDAKAKSPEHQAASEALDKELDDSFPASDPPSVMRKHSSDDA